MFAAGWMAAAGAAPAADLPLRNGEMDSLEGWTQSVGGFHALLKGEAGSRLGADALAVENQAAEMWQRVPDSRFQEGVYTLSAAFEQPYLNYEHDRERLVYLELRTGETLAESKPVARAEHRFPNPLSSEAKALVLRQRVKAGDAAVGQGIVVVVGFSLSGGKYPYGQVRVDTVRLAFAPGAGEDTPAAEPAPAAAAPTAPPPVAIGINFDAPGAADDLGPDEVAGLAPAANWNTCPAADGTRAALRLADGATSQASITLKGIRAGNLAADFAPRDADEKLLRGRFDFRTETGEYPTIAVSGLPPALAAGRYDVILYTYRPPNVATFCAEYDLGGVRRLAFPATELPGTNGWQEAPNGGTGHCLVFHGVSGPAFELRAADPPGFGAGAVCALQIVAQPADARTVFSRPLSRLAADDVGTWRVAGQPAPSEPSWLPDGGECVRLAAADRGTVFDAILSFAQGPDGIVKRLSTYGFDRLCCRVRNPSGDMSAWVDLGANLIFRGTGGTRAGGRVDLAPGESREVTVDLAARSAVQRLDELPGVDIRGGPAVLLDDLELASEPWVHQRALRARVQALRHALDARWPAVAGKAPKALADARTGFDRLEADVQRLAGEMEAGTIGWWQAMRRVLELEGEEEADRGQRSVVGGRNSEDTTASWARVRVLAPALDALAAAPGAGAPFALASTDAMTRVFLEADRLPRAALGRPLSLKAARHEAESGQVTVVPLAGDLTALTLRLPPLVGPAAHTLTPEIRVLGYVYCRNTMLGDTEGWWPDPLLEGAASLPAVRLGETATFWLTVTVPGDAPAGRYAGAIAVSAQGVPEQTLPVEIEVYDFAIPEPAATSLQTDVFEAEERYLEPLLNRYRLNLAGDGEGAWSDGKMRAMARLGKQDFKVGEVSGFRSGGPYVDPALPAKLRVMTQQLARAEAADVRDRCYVYGYDEAGHPIRGPGAVHEPEALFNTAKQIHKFLPDLKIQSTPLVFSGTGPEVDMTDGVRDLDMLVAWIGNYDHFPDKMKQARHWGYEMWAYACLGISPPMGNIYTDVNSFTDMRCMLGAQAFKQGWRGFLYWALRYGWSQSQPLTPLAPDRVKTAFRPLGWGGGTLSWMVNGEGHLIYPGPAEADGFNPMLGSVRLENLRDGIEDYEYYILASKVDRAAAPPPETVFKHGAAHSREPADYQAEKARLAALILSRKPAPAPGNAAPQISAPAAADPVAGMSTTVSVTAVDPDDAPGPLTYAWTAVGGPVNGVAFAAPNEARTAVTFSKPGAYRLRVVVSDGYAYSRADVVVTAGDPSVPVARPDRYAATAGTPLAVAAPGVLANDEDAAFQAAQVEALLVTPPLHGKVMINADGSFRYFAEKSYAGSDQFAYKALNPFGMESAAVAVAVDVASAPAPTAVVQSAAGGPPRPGLRLWLRSDRGVETTAGAVTAWRDQSGNGHDAAAGNPDGRPALVPDSLWLGLPAIRFDGENDVMRGAKGLDMLMPGPFTVALAITPKGVWPKGIISLDPGGGGSDWEVDEAFCVTHSQKDGKYALTCTQGYYTLKLGAHVPVEFGVPTVAVFSRPVGADEAVLTWRDGVPSPQKAAADIGGTIPCLQQAGYVLGARVPGGHFGQHDLYEVLVYDRVLSAEELKALHSYLLSPRTVQ